MKNQRVVLLLLSLLVTVLNSARAQVTPLYFTNGGNLQLRPTVKGPITSILWKFNGDLLAEWIDDNVELTYYGDFKDRATLDIKTGHLEIGNMDETKDSGSYTLEINNKVHGQSYDAKAISKVPTPSVWISPVACDLSRDNCTLTCEGATKEAEPVAYTWWRDDTEQKGVKTREVPFLKTETGSVKTFSCRMENPVSEAKSEPKDNPFYVESVDTNVAGPVVGGLFGVLILVLVGVGIWKRDSIKNKLSPSQGNYPVPAAEAEGKTENSTPPADEVPLNKNGGDGVQEATDPV